MAIEIAPVVQPGQRVGDGELHRRLHRRAQTVREALAAHLGPDPGDELVAVDRTDEKIMHADIEAAQHAGLVVGLGDKEPSAALMRAWCGSRSTSTRWYCPSAAASRSWELARSSTRSSLALRPVSATAAAKGSPMPKSREAMARVRISSVTAFSRTRLRTRAISAVSSSGFVRNSSAPASRPLSRSPGWSRAVTMMTGRCAVSGAFLSRRQTSKPSIPGIMTSRRTMSHRPCSQSASASGPFIAVTTSKYSALSFVSSSLTFGKMSSTTRTRAVMMASLAEIGAHGREELRDRDRLRQIGLAAALADALLVALHGEGGNGDDRDGLEVVVLLQPLRDLEAGDFGKLDVHQDEIGLVGAGELERLDAVAGLQGGVAMRLEEVVEELHIELVVLDDENGFLHDGCPAGPRASRARPSPRPHFAG